jgi:peptide/nickel transport system substrate-binding protein
MPRLVLALQASLVLSCMREPADPGQPRERVVIILESPPRDLDPRLVSEASSTKVSRLIFCSLTTLETDDARPALEAAESVRPACPEGEAGCLHWVVSVKEGIYWHDGVEVGPDDVEFTFRSILESTLPSPFRGDLQRKIERVWVEGGEAHFLLTAPSATLWADLSIGLVPRHILEPRGGVNGRFEDDFVGCGPYRFLYRYGDQKVALARNELYWKEVAVPYVVVRTVPDEATRVLAMMAGSGQLTVNTLSPPIVRTLEEKGELQVLHRPAACTTYLAFNLLDERLAKLEVREAIAYALDRESIVREQFRGMAIPARSVLPPFHWAHAGDLVERTHEPELARWLLDKAGLPADPNTGLRTRFTLKTTSDRFRRSIGAVLAHQLRQVGLEIELLPLELSTFLADVRKGNFEMYVLQLPEVTEPDILRWFFHSQAAPVLVPVPGASRYGREDRTLFPPRFWEVSGPLAMRCRAEWFPLVVREAFLGPLRRAAGLRVGIGTGNRSFFFDPALDCCLDLGRVQMKVEERLVFYHEAQRIVADAIPVLPLWHEDNVAVVGPGVQGYRLLPINRYSPISDVSLVGE